MGLIFASPVQKHSQTFIPNVNFKLLLGLRLKSQLKIKLCLSRKNSIEEKEDQPINQPITFDPP